MINLYHLLYYYNKEAKIMCTDYYNEFIGIICMEFLVIRIRLYLYKIKSLGRRYG